MSTSRASAEFLDKKAIRERLLAMNPFPGLRPFEYADRHLFAGREHQIEDVRARLADNNFLAVIGVSGSGKSSLIKAGVVPVLYQGFLESAGPRWNIAVMRPGREPLRRLAEALRDAELITKEGTPIEALKKERRGLLSIAARFRDDENLLLVIDQFEEIFRYKDLSESSDADTPLMAIAEADAFIRLLLDGLNDDRIFIVTTMRSDYLGDCARFPKLAKQINRGQYLIPALLPDEQRQIVEFPINAKKGINHRAAYFPASCGLRI